MNNKNVRNTKNKNKFVKLVIGLSIGLILLTGTTFVLAREMPKYDKNLNTWDKIIYSLKGGWEAVFNPGVKHNSPVSYTHLTLPTILRSCRSRWSPYH